MHEFTVAQILDAAEKNTYKNFNDNFIEYDETDWNDKPLRGSKVIQACVIGEAFLNLGLVENGTDARSLSHALAEVIPDDNSVTIERTVQSMGKVKDTYYDLSTFINELNGYAGYKGKKRVVRLARKYFSKSLDQVVKF